jgi:short-subunit dehydrogenase
MTKRKLKMKNNQFVGKWAIVTGASKGLGFCYAEEFLKKGINVIGVARNSESLIELANKYPDLKVEMINLDLSDSRNWEVLISETKKFDVAYIVNNAGYGVWGFFKETEVEREMNMIDLNIKALHYLTKHFVKKFDAQGYGRVINIGSLAAFVPAPVFSSYYASKSYVWSLGMAVDFELKKSKSKARVVTLCPGPLKTDFWNRSSEQENAKYKSTVKVMRTDVYAKKSLAKAMKTKKSFLVVGSTNKVMKWFSIHAPRKIVLNSIYNYQRKR